MTGLILGRSPNLWLGAFVAVFSTIGLVFHFPADVIGSVDLAASAVIVLIAGNDQLTERIGKAAAIRRNKV